MKLCLLTLICLATMGFQSMTQADESEWKFGIGTGFFALNIDGEIGLNLTTLGLGGQQFDVDLSADDTMDLMETAIGFGGYATNGSWLIDYGFNYLELVDTISNDIVERGEFTVEVTGFEILVGYPVFKTPNIVISLHGGARYVRHELTSDITASGTRAIETIDEDWIDALFGVSANIPLSDKWMWINKFNAGFGGSEGTYQGFTGLNWQFHKSWSAGVYGRFTAVEFENGHKGDKDWYFYDADEYGAGINIFYHF